jgi:phosphatidate cytidylyltransferase
VSDLYRRVVVSSISISILILLFLLAYNPIFQYVIAIATAVLSAIAVWEYAQFAKVKGGHLVTEGLMVLSALEVGSFFLAAQNPRFASLPLVIFFLGFLVLFALHFGKKDGAIFNLAVSSFGLLYIAVPMGMFLGILYAPSGDGKWWFAFLLVVTKITDVGAYFAGNLWGKHRLAPTISPKKTVEGAIFGLACSLAASYLFYLVGKQLGSFHLTTSEWVFLGIGLGVVGQFGDLSESLLKRDANKKDSNVLPGLGGVLDLVDSLLFNGAIIYTYIQFFKV